MKERYVRQHWMKRMKDMEDKIKEEKYDEAKEAMVEVRSKGYRYLLLVGIFLPRFSPSGEGFPLCPEICNIITQ